MGYTKVKEYFSEVVKKGPKEIVNHLKDKGTKWSGIKENEDDVTFVVIKVK